MALTKLQPYYASIMPLLTAYYAQNYASIICMSLACTGATGSCTGGN